MKQRFIALVFLTFALGVIGVVYYLGAPILHSEAAYTMTANQSRTSLPARWQGPVDRTPTIYLDQRSDRDTLVGWHVTFTDGTAQNWYVDPDITRGAAQVAAEETRHPQIVSRFSLGTGYSLVPPTPGP